MINAIMPHLHTQSRLMHPDRCITARLTCTTVCITNQCWQITAKYRSVTVTVGHYWSVNSVVTSGLSSDQLKCCYQYKVQISECLL